MTELGVVEVSDLVDVYSYADILEQIQSKVSPVEYKRFLRACKTTKCLADVVLPDSANSAIMASTIFSMPSVPTTAPRAETTRMPPMPPPTMTAEQIAQKRLADLVAARDEAARKAASIKTVTETETKIREMEEEIRRIEMATVVTAAAKLEKGKREGEMASRLAEVKKRRQLIDGKWIHDFANLDSLMLKNVCLCWCADLHDKLQAAASLDMVFMLDCTGSMGSYIAAAKDQIREFVASLAKLYPDIPLRLAFVGYRDHCDGDNRLAVLRFTTSVAEFQAFVALQRDFGGGDAPEDVFGEGDCN